MLDTHTTLRWPFSRFERKSVTPAAVGWLSLAITIISGATYSAFAKQLSNALSPLSLLFFSELLTAGIVLLSFGTIPTLKSLLRLPRAAIIPLVIVGVMSSIFGPFLWFIGLTGTTAVNASLFGNSDIVFLLLLAVVMLGEEWSAAHISAAASIILGIAFIALKGFSDGLTVQPGDLLILVSAFCFSVGSITFRRYLHHAEPHIVIFVRSSVAVATLAVLSPFFSHSFVFEIRNFPLTLILPFLGFAFIARFLNVFSFYAAIDRLPVSTVSLFSSFNILVSPLFAWMYLGSAESLHWYHAVGAGFILLGTLMLELLGVHSSEKHLEQHLHQDVHRPI